MISKSVMRFLSDAQVKSGLGDQAVWEMAWEQVLCEARLQRWPIIIFVFNFYRTQVSLGSGLWVPVSLTPGALWNFADVTLADDDTNSILANDANRAIWGWWFSSNRWWSSPMWAWRSPRGSARWWYRSCTEYWSWWAVIMLATIYVVGTLGGNGCHWDGGGRVGWQGGAQGGKGGYQGVVECLMC